MTGIENLAGPALIAAICGLLFTEELGVPLPFAPGDLVLGIGGIAIASGRVNPVLVVGLTFVAVVVGAMLGREITALLGWERLMKIARPLRAKKPLERAADLLRRGGWRTVFTARLIPGLRVYTTQMAGVTGVSRSTFFAGLVPSAVVYVGGFMGLGAAFGRPLLALVQAGTHQVVLGALALAVGVVILLWLRIRVRRTLESLAVGGWTGPFHLRLDPLEIMVLPLCLGINFAGHAIAISLKLPLFLDSPGTILAGVVAGPWVGGSVGVLSNLLTSNTFQPIASSYAIVSFAVGFAAGLSRYLNWQRRASGWILLWVACVAVASLLSTPINFLVSGGQSGVAFGDAIYAWLGSAHVPRVLAAFIGEVAVDLPDKLIAVVAALSIAQALSRQPAASGAVDLDLREPFAFVFRSPHWVRRTLAGVVALMFFWLVIPGLLLLGYLVALSRSVRDGAAVLPPWDHRWQKVRDGFKLTILFGLWSLPGIVVSLIAGILTDPTVEQALGTVPTAIGDALNALGNVWQLLVLVIQAAVWGEYLRGGFRGALSIRAILGRLRLNLSLTLVVVVLTFILLVVGIAGVIGLVIGVLVTLVYVGFVWSNLIGVYARLTDPLPGRSRLVAEPAPGASVG
jgi:energy-coupling factor transport system substrate-specific component